MASLKEVKTRIASVNSTRKITSAMKMVASSKLHSAQQAIENMRPYEERLMHILTSFIKEANDEFETPFAVKREVKRAAIILFTSNSSLCGGFNANVIKEFNHKVELYRQQGIEPVRIYPFGKKAAEAVNKAGFKVPADYSSLLDSPNYLKIAQIVQEIMELYVSGEFDRVDIIYHHFKSAGTQILKDEVFIPIDLQKEADYLINNHKKAVDRKWNMDYIVEPSKEEILTELVPKSMQLKVFTALLDSLASEHAARVIAMQVATDNADDLLAELTLTYNKTRQQAITAELLDIVGGSMQ